MAGLNINLQTFFRTIHRSTSEHIGYGMLKSLPPSCGWWGHQPRVRKVSREEKLYSLPALHPLHIFLRELCGKVLRIHAFLEMSIILNAAIKFKHLQGFQLQSQPL